MEERRCNQCGTRYEVNKYSELCPHDTIYVPTENLPVSKTIRIRTIHGKQNKLDTLLTLAETKVTEDNQFSHELDVTITVADVEPSDPMAEAAAQLRRIARSARAPVIIFPDECSSLIYIAEMLESKVVIHGLETRASRRSSGPL